MDTYKLETDSDWIEVEVEYRGSELVQRITIAGTIEREYTGVEDVERGDKEVHVLFSLGKRVGEIEVVEDPNFIPVQVATEGNAAISSYLFGVHGMDPSEISERLSVKRNTVMQYISKFKQNTR